MAYKDPFDSGLFSPGDRGGKKTFDTEKALRYVIPCGVFFAGLLIIFVLMRAGNTNQEVTRAEMTRVVSDSSEFIFAKQFSNTWSIKLNSQVNFFVGAGDMKYVLSRFIKKNFVSAGGMKVSVRQPVEVVARLDGRPVSVNVTEAGSEWWAIEPVIAELPSPGAHTYELTASLNGLDLYSSGGKNFLLLPLVVPSSILVDRMSASISNSSAMPMEGAAWIGTIGKDLEPDAKLETIAVSPGPALTVAAPRSLLRMEGVWVELKW